MLGLYTMNQNNLQLWLLYHPYGQKVLRQLQQHIGLLVGNQTYQHVLQLGLPEVDFLPQHTQNHKHCIAAENAPIVAQWERLPIATESMDLVIVPLVLSQSEQPHAILREVQRVLCGYGQLVVVDINPHSLWRCQQRQFQQITACSHRHAVTPKRLADWLQLLDLQPDLSRFVNYLPLCQQAQQTDKWQWLEAAGNRWWPHAAAMYAVLAIKQTVSLRPINNANKRPERDNEVALNPISIRKPD